VTRGRPMFRRTSNLE